MNASEQQSLAPLLDKLQPLLAGGRLDNVVDLLSLLSDLVDIADNALVEKLSGVFEGLVAAGWEGGMALKMAHTELQSDPSPANFRSLYALLRQPDTLLGLMLVLRTLQIIGQRVRSGALPPEV
ncbi:MAG: hypothetical protein ACTH8H_11340 [Serratia proteamaculans]|jgi:uncharacterized protein YjgD (DUF1641 family)|uniref:SPOC domain-containing protein n=1 Tax=Serratia proteamaculans TaxID=28151 RepID=A0A1W5DU47_SERPR|nr:MULTISPECIES: hypothetical protein [Serratia]SPZ53227.1 Uncharacterised protein [Serratia quinivorans]HCV66575.1 hypothetical protein [Serratia sp. (in: enterobacteria)]KAB1495679.1 hypothetical protein F8R23_13800 [Serratia proteamaculans]MBI6180270.1 hypothetical protein [Serratia proteamaculans]MBO1504527.1 hypothetical protein [Serratia proteamaculans]